MQARPVNSLEKFKSVSNDTKYTMEFPNEIIEEFFMRLPVKSLMKFKCVSKGWNDFVSDERFRRAFRSRQQSKFNGLTGFICNGNRFKVYFIGCHFKEKNNISYTSMSDVRMEKKCVVVASSKGVLLLSDNSIYAGGLSVYDLVSKKHVNIPKLSEDKFLYFAAIGFKYEEESSRSTSDHHRCFRYKVVGIKRGDYRKDSTNNLWVYSSETSTWQKSIMKAKSNFSVQSKVLAKVIGGVFHWHELTAYDSDDPNGRIIAYDSDDPNGRIVLIQFPPMQYDYKSPFRILNELDVTKEGSLQLITIKFDTPTVDVWILDTEGRSYMDEDSVNVSKWRLLHSVSLRDVSLFRDLPQYIYLTIIGVEPANTDIIYLGILNKLYTYNFCKGTVLESSQEFWWGSHIYVNHEWPVWPCL